MIDKLDEEGPVGVVEEPSIAVRRPSRLRVNKEVMKATYQTRSPVQMEVTFSGECGEGPNCTNTLTCMGDCGTFQATCDDCSCISSFVVCCTSITT